MSDGFRRLVLITFSALLVGGVAAVGSEAEASFFDDFRARVEQLRQEREERRQERDRDQEENENDENGSDEENNDEEDERDEDEEERECRCRASLDFSRPQLQFRNGVLTFHPRVDISIRTRGDADDPRWSAHLSYEGRSSYESEDVTVPNGISFSGEREVFNGACGTDYRFRGYQLPAVPLTGITNSLTQEDQDVDGRVLMKATLNSCDTDSVHEAFSFRLRDVLDLRVGSWRRAR